MTVTPGVGEWGVLGAVVVLMTGALLRAFSQLIAAERALAEQWRTAYENERDASRTKDTALDTLIQQGSATLQVVESLRSALVRSP